MHTVREFLTKKIRKSEAKFIFISEKNKYIKHIKLKEEKTINRVRNATYLFENGNFYISSLDIGNVCFIFCRWM